MFVKANLFRKNYQTEIISDPEILGGTFIVSGTRVTVENVLAAVNAGQSDSEIFRHYPSLPLDGIKACISWENERKAL